MPDDVGGAAQGGPSRHPANDEPDKYDTVPSAGDGTGLTVAFVEGLAQSPEPAGSVEAIAVRFMHALQGRQWPAAAAELSLYTRNQLSFTTPAHLADVLEDVRDQAGGSRLGTCTGSRPVNNSAAAVTCGTVLVVVHVDVLLRGVQLSAEHPAGDIVRPPHTHAYTTRDL